MHTRARLVATTCLRRAPGHDIRGRMRVRCADQRRLLGRSQVPRSHASAARLSAAPSTPGLPPHAPACEHAHQRRLARRSTGHHQLHNGLRVLSQHLVGVQCGTQLASVHVKLVHLPTLRAVHGGAALCGGAGSAARLCACHGSIPHADTLRTSARRAGDPASRPPTHSWLASEVLRQQCGVRQSGSNPATIRFQSSSNPASIHPQSMRRMRHRCALPHFCRSPVCLCAMDVGGGAKQNVNPTVHAVAKVCPCSRGALCPTCPTGRARVQVTRAQEDTELDEEAVEEFDSLEVFGAEHTCIAPRLALTGAPCAARRPDS